MTREEEIRNAVDTTIPIIPSNNGRTYEQALIASGFEAGIKWADDNPKEWVSVKDCLPQQDEEVIVLVDDLNTAPNYKIAFVILWTMKELKTTTAGTFLMWFTGFLCQNCQNNR